jgi:hypothetical protein
MFILSLLPQITSFAYSDTQRCSNTATKKTKLASSEAHLRGHLSFIIDSLLFYAGMVSFSSEKHKTFDFKVEQVLFLRLFCTVFSIP